MQAKGETAHLWAASVLHSRARAVAQGHSANSKGP